MPNSTGSDSGWERLFPYRAFRPMQKDLISALYRSVSNGKAAVFEAGTGTGKTITALVPAIHAAKETNRRVLYITRTNSQERQVVEEMRAIAAHLPPPLRADEVMIIALQGRVHLCPLASTDSEMAGATSEELAALCRRLRANTLRAMENEAGKKREGPTCPFYKAMVIDGCKRYSEYLGSNIPTAEEAVKVIAGDGMCPYEVLKRHLPMARVVAAPYIYFLSPTIRHALLNWMGTGVEDLIVVVDEAHNLVDFAREIGSAETSIVTLERGLSEAEDLEVYTSHGIPIKNLFTEAQDIILDLRDEYLMEDDGFVPRDALYTEIMARFSITSHTLASIISDLIRIGEDIKAQRLRKGRIPRSYIHSAASFLQYWMGVSEGTHVHLVRSKGHGDPNPKLEVFCLDPRYITSVFEQVHASIHMSGTLRPINEYIDTVGLSRVGHVSNYPSPFPPENRLLLYTPELTTRYEDLRQAGEAMYEGFRSVLRDILSAFAERNTLVLYPSYALYDTIMHEGFKAEIDAMRPCHFDRLGMSQGDLMALIEDFKSSSGGVLFSVLGGRVSEGMDFPSRSLEMVIMVGIPYPKPTARQKALEQYYEMKFRMGWEYGVRAPALRRMLQAAGRLIRSERDRGVVVILDHRAGSFRSDIEGLRESKDLLGDIRAFFGG